METAKGIVRFDPLSTNASANWVLLLVFALGAAFGIEEATILAALPIFYAIREIIEKQRKPRWVGNILTYIFSAITLLAPWLAGLLDATSPIIDALIEGAGIGSIFGLLPMLINQLLILVQTQPWKNDKPTA